MPRHKRAPPSIDSNSASEGGREVKKQKTTPHRGKWDAVLQEYLDFLREANQSLANLNKMEREDGRRGVIPISMVMIETELGNLSATKNIETLEAKLERIDSYLKSSQEEKESYYKTHSSVVTVNTTLNDVIWRIQQARERLPGMFSHLDQPLRKLNVTTHRSSVYFTE